MNRVLAIAALAVLLASCGGDKSSKQTDAAAGAPQAPATATADALASLPEPSRVPFATMMTSYDAILDALAKDHIEGIAAAATAIAQSASTIGATASDASKHQWSAVSTAAMALGSSSTDIPKARASFSELNRALISLLVANPQLAKGRVVIECPMWKGYRKWVQTDEKVRNPFYGRSMLECGVKTELKE